MSAPLKPGYRIHPPFAPPCQNNIVSWSPATKPYNLPGRARRGLVTLVNNSAHHKVLASSRSWIASLIILTDTRIVTISIYFSPDSDLSKELHELRLMINHICSEIPHDIFVIAGDFNARLGSFRVYDPNILDIPSLSPVRYSMDRSTNQRGKMILNFMDINSFVLLNGHTLTDTPGRCTFSNKNGQSTVDLNWISMLRLYLVKNMEINLVITNSDHFPVTVELFTPNANYTQAVYLACKQDKLPIPRWKPEERDA